MPYLFLFAFLHISASHLTEPDLPRRLPLPPGTVRIADNFYADYYEMSNINYLEYLYWLEQIYGQESETYQKALPDTSVWLQEDAYAEPFVQTYFRHPAYSDYPVVGISYEQAQSYARWRSDRVYEYILIRKKKLVQRNYPEAETAQTHFTAERYLSGNFFGYTPDRSIPVPEYRLPTPEEWERIASGGLDKSQYSYGIDPKKLPARIKYLQQSFNFASCSGDDNIRNCTVPVGAFKPNGYKVYQCMGNVAEMTSEPGIAKGGSFIHDAESTSISTVHEYQGAKCWLGVRMVCSWYMPD